MSRNRCAGALGAALVFVFAAASSHAAFIDSFEGPTLDPFWNFSAQLSGSYAFSPTQFHSGSKSLQFTSINNGGQKDIEVAHQFATPTFGDYSVWFYDSGAGQASGNYANFYSNVNQPSNFWGAGLVVRSDSLGADNQYFGSTSTGLEVPSGVTRSLGWHQFRLQTRADALVLSVDGVDFYTAASVGPSTDVTLIMHGASIDPPAVTYFDDFSFTALPEPAALAVAPLFALALRRRRRGDRAS